MQRLNGTQFLRAGPVIVCVTLLIGLMSYGMSLSVTDVKTVPSALRPGGTAGSSASPSAAPVQTDWPCLFGATHLGLSSETDLNLDWPEAGPSLKWSKPIGTGYSSPVVKGRHLILSHRLGDEEIVESFDTETGESNWSHSYPTAYVCRYEYSNGPYSTPVIGQQTVFAWGAEGIFHALALDTGDVKWRRQLSDDFGVPENLFAVGTSPLVEGDLLILNVGGRKDNSGIVALDKTTGETVWSATNDAAGYATPIAATIHNKRFLFVFTADGLVALDPSDGRVFWSIPFQSRVVDTVNASSPVVWNDLVLVTIGPGPGALCVRVVPDGSYEEVWRDRRAIDSTFNNLICRDGYIFGFSSRRNHAAGFRCVDMKTGDVMWDWSSDVSRGASLWVDGRCIMIGEYGHLGMVDAEPRGLTVRYLSAESMFARPCYAAPALSNGLLFIRDNERIACFDLRRSR